MSANLQYADSMSPMLESKLRSLYNRTAEAESEPSTTNSYTGAVFGGEIYQQQHQGYGGRLLGGESYGTGLVGGRKPRVRPGRGNGSARQKEAANCSAWVGHIRELMRERPGLKYKDALKAAASGATGYVKGTRPRC